MLSILKSLWKSEGQEDIQTPKDYNIDFHLMYKTLKIGTLSLAEGMWSFSYSEAFKQQSLLQPLLDFPDVEKTYTSEELQPFFAHRIPGTGQPKVKKVLAEENIDAHNEAKMLERFGKISITNPFQLEVV